MILFILVYMRVIYVCDYHNLFIYTCTIADTSIKFKFCVNYDQIKVFSLNFEILLHNISYDFTKTLFDYVSDLIPAEA